MEAFKIVCSGRLRPSHQHHVAQSVAVDQTVRQAHSVWPHWIADAIAEVANLLIVKVRDSFVLERHELSSNSQGVSDRSGGERSRTGDRDCDSTTLKQRRIGCCDLKLHCRAQIAGGFGAKS